MTGIKLMQRITEIRSLECFVFEFFFSFLLLFWLIFLCVDLNTKGFFMKGYVSFVKAYDFNKKHNLDFIFYSLLVFIHMYNNIVYCDMMLGINGVTFFYNNSNFYSLQNKSSRLPQLFTVTLCPCSVA